MSLPVVRDCSFCVILTHQHSTKFLFLTAAWHSQHMHTLRFIKLMLFQFSLGGLFGVVTKQGCTDAPELTPWGTTFPQGIRGHIPSSSFHVSSSESLALLKNHIVLL